MGRAPPPPDTLESQEAAVLNGIDQHQLQRSIITRLVKGALPPDAKLQKDVTAAMSTCSTLFINYLAASAHDVATGRQVKTISAQDVISCLQFADLWPDELKEVLLDNLEAYRTYGPRRAPSQPKKSKTSSSSASAKPSAAASGSGTAGQSLKIKLSTGGAKGKGKAPASAGGADGAQGVRSEDEEDEEDSEEDEDDDDDDDEDDEEEEEDAADGKPTPTATAGGMDVDGP